MDAAELLSLVSRWLRGGLPILAAATLGFGAFSAAQPRASIRLYQTIMAGLNWRVEPIDQAHELRTTRWFGGLLVLLSLVTLGLLRASR